MSDNTITLNENLPPQGAGEAAAEEDGMDLGQQSSRTEVASVGLQNLGLGGREKQEKELAIANQLLDEVREICAYNKKTRSQSKNSTVTHTDIDKALHCSSHPFRTRRMAKKIVARSDAYFLKIYIIWSIKMKKSKYLA